MKVVLASASPQRRRLLEDAGIEFVVVPADVEEASAGSDPARLAIDNARAKAVAVSAAIPDALVIGSDTVVAVDDRCLGKPASRAEAAGMLTLMSGRGHAVHSAVCVAFTKGEGGATNEVVEVDTTDVVFRELDPTAIETHLDLGEWQGRAGGYAIQETGIELVDRIDGRLDTVIGMPMDVVVRLLREAVHR